MNLILEINHGFEHELHIITLSKLMLEPGSYYVPVVYILYGLVGGGGGLHLVLILGPFPKVGRGIC